MPGDSASIPEHVISDIRSVLLSHSKGVKVVDFPRDYKKLIGQPLDYRKYHYDTLTALLESIKDVVV